MSHSVAVIPTAQETGALQEDKFPGSGAAQLQNLLLGFLVLSLYDESSSLNQSPCVHMNMCWLNPSMAGPKPAVI